MDMTYFQPVAGHVDASSYLIVRNSEDRWFLWDGQTEERLIEIPETMANWMRQRPELEDIPLPRFWFEAASLPLAESGRHGW